MKVIQIPENHQPKILMQPGFPEKNWPRRKAAQKKLQRKKSPGFFLFRAAWARFDWHNVTAAERRQRRAAGMAGCPGALKFSQFNPAQGLNGRIGKIRLQMPAGGSALSRDLFLQSGCFSLKIMHLL